MVSRFLEKKVEVVLDGFSQKEQNSLELEYYLLESECTEDEERNDRKTYGVEIIKRYQGILNEKRRFENIFSTREMTKNLVDLLAVNTVTPSTLPYILDDLLGQ